MGLKKIELNKKQKIIAAITTVLLISGATIGYFAVSENIKQNKIIANTVEPYVIPGKEKIFMSGKVVPKESQDIFVNPELGELNVLKVANEQYVEKGTVLFTTKNASKIEEIENLKLQIDMKKKEKQNIQSQSGEGQDNSSAIQSIDLEIKNLQSQINRLDEAAYKSVKAPFSGKVYLNDSKQQGSPILTMQSTKYYIKAQVNERDSFKVAQNQEVDIKVLANDEKLDGEITYVGDNPLDGEELSQNSGANSSFTNYRVNISIDEPENIKNGLHVQIVALHGIDDKKVPTNAILKEGNKSYVYKVQGNKAYKTEVTVSEVKSDFSMIKRGLIEGEMIIKNIKDRTIEDGQQVYTGGY